MEFHRLNVFTKVPGEQGRRIEAREGSDAAFRLTMYRDVLPFTGERRRRAIADALAQHRSVLRSLGYSPTVTVLLDRAIVHEAPAPQVGDTLTVPA